MNSHRPVQRVTEYFNFNFNSIPILESIPNKIDNLQPHQQRFVPTK